MSAILTANGPALTARRRLRDLSIGAAIFMIVGSILWWSPQSKHDHDPECQPGQVELMIARQATPSTLSACIPETFLRGEIRELRPW